jgi:hypothetical protein
MRVHIATLVGLVLPMLVGCAATRDCSHGNYVTVREARPAELASALLFDPRPARYDAQAFAQRSDWPSAVGYYSPGQVIYYNERFVDYQGRGWGAFSGDSLGTYRRADSYKVGVGYR